MGAKAWCVPLLCAAAIGSGAAMASTNPQFSAQVQAHREALARSAAVAADTARLCAGLDARLAMDEPRCVAWRLHQRSRSDRAAACEADEGPFVTRIARCLLHGLAGSAA